MSRYLRGPSNLFSFPSRIVFALEQCPINNICSCFLIRWLISVECDIRHQTIDQLPNDMFHHGSIWGEFKGAEWNIKDNIKQINQFSQLDMIGELIIDSRRDFPPFIQDIAKDVSYTNTQIIPIGLIIPIPLNPAVAYQVLVKVVDSSGFRITPAKWQFTCLMRLVQASLLAQKSRELVNARTLHNFHESDRKGFQVPLSHLFVESLNFIYEVPELTHNLRTDAIAFFYSGLNRQFAVADERLQRSWVLSKAAQDMRTSIVNMMSFHICTKLTGVSEGRSQCLHFSQSGGSEI
jgi:hypothetical protein